MFQFHDNSTKKYFIGLMGILFVACLSSCLPVLTGTAEEATAARASMQIGEAKLDKVYAEISDLLVNFRDVIPAQLLINEPLALPQAAVILADLSPWFGVHRETSPDVFEFTADTESRILVEYANGIDLLLGNFTFGGSEGEVDNFNIDITSNNRVATPENEVVTIHFAEWRPDIKNEVTLPITPSIVKLSGSATYVDSTQAIVNYNVTRQKILGKGQTPAQVSLGETHDFYIQDVLTGRHWHRNLLKVFVPSGVAGTWVAWSIYKLYDDTNVLYSTFPVVQGEPVAGVATYGVEFPKINVIKYNSVKIGTITDKRVATVAGGPYSCDVNVPGGIGSGTDIVVNWVDLEVTGVLPGTQNCPEMIFVEPPAAPVPPV